MLRLWRSRSFHLLVSRRLAAGAFELLACSLLLFLGGDLSAEGSSEEVKLPALSSSNSC